jgi:hypothetical protein
MQNQTHTILSMVDFSFYSKYLVRVMITKGIKIKRRPAAIATSGKQTILAKTSMNWDWFVCLPKNQVGTATARYSAMNRQVKDVETIQKFLELTKATIISLKDEWPDVGRWSKRIKGFT